MDEGSLLDSKRKFTRQWLKEATKTDYDLVVSEAHLTDEQLNILTKTIKGDTQIKQSLENCCDVSCIKRKTKQVYDKIYVALVSLFYDTF